MIPAIFRKSQGSFYPAPAVGTEFFILYGRDPQGPFTEGTAVFPRDENQIGRQNDGACQNQKGGMKVQTDQYRNAGQNTCDPADIPEQIKFTQLNYTCLCYIRKSIAALCKVFCREYEKSYTGKGGQGSIFSSALLTGKLSIYTGRAPGRPFAASRTHKTRACRSVNFDSAAGSCPCRILCSAV